MTGTTSARVCVCEFVLSRALVVVGVVVLKFQCCWLCNVRCSVSRTLLHNYDV